jgi:hypothetical protein
MYEKTLTIFLTLVALFSLGSGITGFASFTSSGGACFDDSDCTYSVCCDVKGEVYGVCGQQNECGAVYENIAPSQRAPEVEEIERNYLAVGFGILLLLVIGIVSYVEWHQEVLHPGHHEKKSSKKKVKRKKKK